jgi:hypothetical protein
LVDLYRKRMICKRIGILPGDPAVLLEKVATSSGGGDDSGTTVPELCGG